MEQRFLDEKDRAQKRMNDMIREHEQKLDDERQNHVDEVEMINLELNHNHEEYRQVIQQLENELSLKCQQAEALDRYYNETKQTLDRQQAAHQQSMEQLQVKLNSERKELTEKVDMLTSEITRRERACTTLENQKESIQQQLVQKEKALNAAQQDMLKEKSDYHQRTAELKQKLEEKEDELT